jgi:signal transduction histidine kinase
VAEVAQAVAPEFTLDVRAPEPVHTVVDPLRIEQVLVNLIDNARKYSPAGTHIDISVLPDPETVSVSVRDRGQGIPEEERERIFERFHRLARDQNGLGLGLHISREIARGHGGDLVVEAPADGGSRFIVRLPRQK